MSYDIQTNRQTDRERKITTLFIKIDLFEKYRLKTWMVRMDK